MSTPQHHIIKETSESLSDLLTTEFKRNGYKRVHIVEQAPKPEAIEGKLPAVSARTCSRSRSIPRAPMQRRRTEIVEVAQDDGTVKEFARRRRLWVRLDYLISAWAQTPEDEQLLLGLVIRTLLENAAVKRERLKGISFEDDFELNWLMSSRLDEGTLSRASGAACTSRSARRSKPGPPSRSSPMQLDEFKRVQSRQLEYKSITDPRISETGPSGNPFLGSRRLDLGGAATKK